MKTGMGRGLLRLTMALIGMIGLVSLVACGGGGGGGGSSSTGSVSVGLTDATTTDYKAVYITVGQVAVSKNGEDWEIVGSPNRTYNLLTLVNGVQQALGTISLPGGRYNQVRLILGDTPDSPTHPYANYFIDKDDNPQELKVPSGYQTGIKIVKGFEINANRTTELLLDFDAARSIIKAGSSGQWLLKPTIKVLTTVEYSVIEGSVTSATGAVEGVLITAQVYTAGAITTQAGTVSDAAGHYRLFLQPGTYTVVGFKEGYVPYHSPTKVIATAGAVETHNFLLSGASMGTVEGSVYMSGAGAEDYATVSIRMDAGTEQIEVKSIFVTNTNASTPGTFSIGLPVGSYSAYISAGESAAVPQIFTISAGGTTTLSAVSF